MCTGTIREVLNKVQAQKAGQSAYPMASAPTNVSGIDPASVKSRMKYGLATTMSRKTGNPLPGSPGFLTSGKLQGKQKLGG